MVGFLAAYTDVVNTLEASNFNLRQGPDDVPGGEYRRRVCAWRFCQAVTCAGICTALFVGGGLLSYGPVSALFWASAVVGSLCAVQIAAELILTRKRSYSRSVSSSLLWYDIFFDALVFEFHHYLTLILFGVVVEYPFGGTALQVVERLGYEEQVRILIGSPYALIVAVVLGVVMASLLLLSAKEGADRILAIYAKAAASDKKAGRDEKTGDVEVMSSSGDTGSDQEPLWEVILGEVLIAVGSILKVIQNCVTDAYSWKYSGLCILNRLVQVAIGIFSIAVANVLLEMDQILTWYIMLVAGWSMAVLSSVAAILETTRFMAWACKSEFFGPTSTLARVVSVSWLVYDITWVNITNLASAFGFAVSFVFCLLDYRCLYISLVSGALLYASFTHYFAATQSYNALQEMLASTAKPDVGKESDEQSSSPAKQQPPARKMK